MNRFVEMTGPVILFLVIGTMCGMAISESRFKSRLQTATRKAQADAILNKDLYQQTVLHLKAANRQLSEEFGRMPFSIPGIPAKANAQSVTIPSKKPKFPESIP